MLPPFRMGLGGPVGSGRQWLSWISINDVVGGIQFVLGNPNVSGPVNFTAPNPVTNAEFGKALGKVLRRPAIFPLPAFVVRLLFGEMGEEVLLSSVRAVPKKLKDAGYSFTHEEIGAALSNILGDV
jgi:uncharacterized protein (TIGR01777 family)